MGIPVTLSPSSKHTTMTSCIYLVFIIPRLLNFTLKYSRDKSHTRHLLFDCRSTVCTCARHIIRSIPPPPPRVAWSTWLLIMFIIRIKILTIVMSTISIGTSFLILVVNLYLTRVIPSEYLKVSLLSIGALN